MEGPQLPPLPTLPSGSQNGVPAAALPAGLPAFPDPLAPSGVIENPLSSFPNPLRHGAVGSDSGKSATSVAPFPTSFPDMRHMDSAKSVASSSAETFLSGASQSFSKPEPGGTLREPQLPAAPTLRLSDGGGRSDTAMGGMYKPRPPRLDVSMGSPPGAKPGTLLLLHSTSCAGKKYARYFVQLK